VSIALVSEHSSLENKMKRFVVVGAGPVGKSTTQELLKQGHAVDLVTRSGSGPDVVSVNKHALDATNATALTKLAVGATAIINAANPPYTKWDTQWPPIATALLNAAQQSGAALVTMSNLYGHGPAHQTMTADTPMDSVGKKGVVRATMWANALAAHTAGKARVAEVRASDFFGPEVRDANMGERVVPRVLAGKGVQLLGRADVPHSFSYMPDVARTLAQVALHDDTWGRAWLVPSNTLTQREMIRALCTAAQTPEAKVSTLPKVALTLLSPFVPLMRELQEVWYQFDAPFVVDATETTSELGIAPTPIDQALAATVAWWRDQK
jgi:nucleoside-diphosphate-sugar epimerase